MARGSMRDQMPQVAAWVDGLRAEFGTEAIDASIRAGLNGEPTFYAVEAGREIGCRATVERTARTLVLGRAELDEISREVRRARSERC